MSEQFIKYAVEGVQSLLPYQAGKPIDELQRELGLEKVVKLASNENPLGLSPLAKTAIDKQLADLARYPDANGFRLKQKLAEKLHISASQITLGNGSNDVLDLVGKVFLKPGVSAVFSEHAFIVYPLMIKALNAEPIQVPAVNYGHDLKAMAAAIKGNTRIIFVANPNNPTGTAVGQKALLEFLDSVPSDVIVVLDEAYFEYYDTEDAPDGLSLLQQYPNMVVTRTFSKAWGLAGLRVGYAVSSPEVADLLNRVREPFNVNNLALAAAEAVLDDEPYLQQGRDVNAAGMQQLEKGLQDLGLEYIPSEGNFIAVDFKQDAMPIFNALLKQGVIVRPVGIYGMPTFLRISIGLEEENAFCLEKLALVLKEMGHSA